MRDKWQLAMLVVVVAAGSWDAGAEETTESAKPEAQAKAAEEFKPPPGYRTRRRGDKVVYCKKEPARESRLMTEKCYDETQLRELLFSIEQQRSEIDQRRRICPSPATCGA